MNQTDYMTVGTVRNGGSIKGNGKGVYSLVIRQDGSIQETGLLEADSISFICHGNGNVMYGVSETKDFSGLNGSGGGVIAFIRNSDGTLSLLDRSISYGSRPCYLTMTQSGRYLLVANHGSHTTVTCSYQKKEDGSYELVRGFDESSVAVFALKKDGSFDRLCDLVKMEGKGYWCHGGGQSTSHIHCVIEKNGTVIVCNRGTDEIAVMKLDENTGKLTPVEIFHVHAGYAPRHAVFHPSLPVIYVIFENYPAVGIYEIRKDDTLQLKRIIGTMEDSFYLCHPLPLHEKRHADVDEVNTCAMMNHRLPMGSQLQVTHDGKILFVSSRLYSSVGCITSYGIDASGDLHLQHVNPMPGSDIRGFGLDEKNRILAAGIMDRNRIVLFSYDDSIRLQETHQHYDLAAPSCIIF